MWGNDNFSLWRAACRPRGARRSAGRPRAPRCTAAADARWRLRSAQRGALRRDPERRQRCGNPQPGVGEEKRKAALTAEVSRGKQGVLGWLIRRLPAFSRHPRLSLGGELPPWRACQVPLGAVLPSARRGIQPAQAAERCPSRGAHFVEFLPLSASAPRHFAGSSPSWAGAGAGAALLSAGGRRRRCVKGRARSSEPRRRSLRLPRRPSGGQRPPEPPQRGAQPPPPAPAAPRVLQHHRQQPRGQAVPLSARGARGRCRAGGPARRCPPRRPAPAAPPRAAPAAVSAAGRPWLRLRLRRAHVSPGRGVPARGAEGCAPSGRAPRRRRRREQEEAVGAVLK
ncbi:uncharacterized protein LOC134564520 [Prinia subflava]|uniref:uncharacterized protein LOC134564520 n=1 Tax=Prinia subflava TaxID=208062 RepID=UPI002FE2B843